MKHSGFFLFVLVLILTASFAWAQDFEPAGESDFYDKVPSFAISILKLATWGVVLRYMRLDKPLIKNFLTGFVIEGGGGYWTRNYYYTSTGEDYLPYENDPDLSYYNQMNFTAGIGIMQGFKKKEHSNFDSLSAFLLLRSVYNKQFQNENEEDSLFYEAGLKENDSIWINSFVIGLDYKDIDTHKFRLSRRGINLALSTEGGLSFFPELNDTDLFMQSTAKFMFFLPFFDRNEVAIYLGYRAMIDYIFGSYIPQDVLQRFGGREYTTGLGMADRGLYIGQYSGKFKAISNLDIRINFPDMFGYIVVPSVVLFYDIGFSDNMRDTISTENINHSLGVGFALHYGAFGCTYNIAYNINEDYFHHSFSFGTHF